MSQATGEGPDIRLKPHVVVGTKTLIEGSTDAGTLLTYSVNGAQESKVDVKADGTFSFFATLTRPGVNEIIIRGQSPNGAITELMVPAEYRTD